MKYSIAFAFFCFFCRDTFAGQSSGGGPAALQVATEQFAALAADIRSGDLIELRNGDGSSSVYKPFMLAPQKKLLAATSVTDNTTLVILGVEEQQPTVIINPVDASTVEAEIKSIPAQGGENVISPASKGPALTIIDSDDPADSNHGSAP